MVVGLAWVWQELIDLFELLGLVYVRPSAPRRFYPTHLVLDLSSQGAFGAGEQARASSDASPASSAFSKMDAEVEEGRCLIIETNYRMYAYTTSVLQEQVLRLFTEINYKMPHMLIGVITRKSIRKALTTGITAGQIINYLHMHAHPQVALCFVLSRSSCVVSFVPGPWCRAGWGGVGERERQRALL